MCVSGRSLESAKQVNTKEKGRGGGRGREEGEGGEEGEGMEEEGGKKG